MSYRHHAVEVTIKRLANAYPRAIFTSPLRVRPLVNDAVETIFNQQSNRLEHETIVEAIRHYRLSRHYKISVSRRDKVLDLNGRAVGEPTRKQVNAAQNWLSNYSIENCKLALAHLKPDPNNIHVDILLNDCRELKSIASTLTKSHRFPEALDARSEIVSIHKLLRLFDERIISERNISYAEYYLNLTTLSVQELAGDFDRAVETVDRLRTHADNFAHDSALFPNWFISRPDLLAHSHLLSAMKDFAQADFPAALDKVRLWQTAMKDAGIQSGAKLSSYKAVGILLDLVVEAQKGSAPHWEVLDTYLMSGASDVERPILVLCRNIREKCAYFSTPNISKEQVIKRFREVSTDIASEWRYLSLLAPLQGADRAVSLSKAVQLPVATDIELATSRIEECWRNAARLILRNSMILKAEYERVRLADNGGKVKTISHSFEIERMNDSDLIDYILSCLNEIKLRKHVREFDNSVPLWRTALEQTHAGSKRDVEWAATQFQTVFRAHPHVVQALAFEPPSGIEKDVDPPGCLQLRRCWNAAGPNSLKFETFQELPVGDYAFMRSRWNKYFHSNLTGKSDQERLYPSRIPRWMDCFEKIMRGNGPAPPERFAHWLQQFSPQVQILALRLLSKLTWLDKDDCQQGWTTLLQILEAKSISISDALIVPIGTAEKSGTHQLYNIEKALTRSGKHQFGAKYHFATADEAFRTKDTPIILVDDMSGSGDTVRKFLKQQISKQRWSPNREVSVLLLAAFGDTIENLSNEFASMNVRFICWRTLSDRDRAFNMSSGIWDNEDDRDLARETLKPLCSSLLAGYEGMDVERDAFGWRGTQALIAFYYNTPNNTLPIFWADRPANGDNWTYLLRRDI